MEIKHTIEILTKDIQDIENLVRNLKKTPTPSRIEIDLAMSKLRNVYELLSIISDDIRSDQSLKTVSDAAASQNAPASEPVAAPAESDPEKNMNVAAERRAAPSASEEPSPEKETEGKDTEKTSPASTVQEQVPETPDSREPAPAKDTREAGQQEETARQEPPAEHSADKEEKNEELQSGDPEEMTAEEERKSLILAEKFAANKNINEKIAPGSDRDLSSKLTGEPIDSIKRHMGINDRFMIIRELLEGDNEKFNKIVGELDNCSNFDEANQIIEKAFSGKTEHEGVTLMTRLARRRYMGR